MNKTDAIEHENKLFEIQSSIDTTTEKKENSTNIDVEILERLSKFDNIDPISNIQRLNQIKEDAALFNDRKTLYARANKLGVDKDVHKIWKLVYSPISSDYCCIEEFCAYTFIIWIKKIMIDMNKHAENNPKECAELISNLFNKYFKYDYEKIKDREFFRDITIAKKEQYIEPTSYQKFMFDFASFRKTYMSLLRRDAIRIGIPAPMPAMFKIRGCYATEEEAVARVEELAAIETDNDNVGSFDSGEYVLFNPTPYQAVTATYSQEDAAKIYGQIKRQQQMSKTLFLQKHAKL
jgi:hypothetical protein